MQKAELVAKSTGTPVLGCALVAFTFSLKDWPPVFRPTSVTAGVDVPRLCRSELRSKKTWET